MTPEEIRYAQVFAYLHPFYRMAAWPVVGEWVAEYIGNRTAQKIERLRQAGLL